METYTVKKMKKICEVFLEAGKKNLLQDGEVVPVFFIFYYDEKEKKDSIALAPMPFKSQDEKDSMIHAAIALSKKLKAKMIAHVSEAWFTYEEGKDLEQIKKELQKTPIRDRDNKRECIIVSAASPDGQSSAMTEIIRENNSISFKDRDDEGASIDWTWAHDMWKLNA